MTLRTRLAAITTALLAIVLAIAGVVLERVTARDLARSLENRVVERARGHAAAADEPPPPEQADPPPPRPVGPGSPPDDPDAPPEDPADRPPQPAPSPLAGMGDGLSKRVLLPESDGAAVEVFHFQPGNALVSPALRAHLTTGDAKLTEADARARLSVRRTAFIERLEIGATRWIVAQDFAPPLDASGRRIEAPRPRMGGPRGGGRPPPPPAPRERRVIAIAFLDEGPAARSHRALVVEMGAIGVGALILGGILSYVLAGRMLRPVAVAARAAERIEHAKARLPAPSANDELGRLVTVLNGMLARLEAASDREKLFLATASHELRRPLTALLGELELASASGRSIDELRSSIALARDDGRAMSRLVDDILRHAKAQAGTLPLMETEVALPDLVADAVKRSRRSLLRPVDVRVDGVPDAIVRADADQLRSALENLVVNAAVHGGDGVRVAVRGEATAAGVRLHVDDDGPGISPEEMRTIFDPFGRGDRARTVPGFGLGLAIARDVARAHGGDLTVVSPCPGADAARPGSRFTLRLAADRVSREPASDSGPVAHS